MTTLVLQAKRGWTGTARYARAVGPWRLALVAAIVTLAATDGAVRGIVVSSLAEAFLQVTVFVAATMALVHGLERLFGFDTFAFLARARAWQVPVAAGLGALPGCGGAIMVVTQYTQGQITFGSVVAVLTATMGDAAFLLLAREPGTALAIFALAFAVGVGSGYVVDAIHGPGFLRPRAPAAAGPACHGAAAPPALQKLWLALLVPGLAAGVLLAAQVDVDAALARIAGPLVPAGTDPTLLLGTAGALLALILWGFMPAADDAAAGASGTASAGGGRLAGIMADTNFVTAWVVLAFLSYELGLYYTGVDLETVFRVWAPLVPLAGVLVGFLPGCGPQIVVTTLYLAGVVPLSAQLGNAISNDGDALFPAIAISPRAAALATLYSALPALVIGYGYYFLWEV